MLELIEAFSGAHDHLNEPFSFGSFYSPAGTASVFLFITEINFLGTLLRSQGF
jgi:hypothetical protein